MIKKIRDLYRRFMSTAEEECYSEALRKVSGFVISKTLRYPVRYLTRRIITPLSIYLHSRFSNNLDVFNEEWDLLIILDTCRVDAIQQVGGEYPFIEEVESRWSVGAQSAEWLMNTFTTSRRNVISRTAYVTSNPHAVTVIKNSLKKNYDGGPAMRINRLRTYGVTSPVTPEAFYDFCLLYNNSTDYGSIKYPSPRSVTDHVINLDRSGESPPKIIAHFMPPHSPYLARCIEGEIEILDESRPSTSFEAYLDNLRWALEEVSVLIENVNREKVVITADHGENFHLRSIRKPHYPGMITPTVRQVPWVVTSATDDRTYEPDLPEEDEQKSMSPEETLDALGYLT